MPSTQGRHPIFTNAILAGHALRWRLFADANGDAKKARRSKLSATTKTTGTDNMGFPGPTELLVIAGILLALVGIPIAIIVLVILLSKRNDKG